MLPSRITGSIWRRKKAKKPVVLIDINILETRDFEDAVQMISAVQCRADFLITRNVQGFQPALLPILAPVDFLATL